MKKSKTTIKKPTPKSEQPIKAIVTEAAPKKPIKAVVTKATSKTSPVKKTSKKAQAVVPGMDAAMPEMTILDRVGLTAGSIWNYLTENGTTSVAKLIRELSEDEKIIQRSIGWLAQEGKVTLDTTSRIETISLKGCRYDDLVE